MPMEAPPRAVPEGDDGYFEVLTKAVFQAGFRWSVVEQKWPNFTRAFAGFHVDDVAQFGPPDVERLLADQGIVRNGRKIEGTIENARVVQELVGDHGSFKAWLDSSAQLPWPERKKVISQPFHSFGPSGAYFFLWSVGEAVPPHDQEPSWTAPVPPGYPEAVTTHS
jgi:DNA-3-methyladenine glycosylase I